VARVTALAWLVLVGPALAQITPAPVEDEHQADDYLVTRWTTAQGLPQNTVNEIVQLANGELWLATFGGLARFDGHAFHVLDIASDEGLPANRIVSLAVAGDDALWFLTQQGHLGRVDGGRPRPLVPPPSVSADAISLFAESTGHIYCKAVDGSVWTTDGSRAWRRVLPPSGSGGVLHAFSAADAGETWVSWGHQLVRLAAGSSVASVRLPNPDPDVFPRAGGGVWLGLGRGLARVVDGRFERAYVQPSLDAQVTAVVSAGAGSLWIASGRDVLRLDRRPDGSWQRGPVMLSLPGGAQVRALTRDRRDNLWVGTDGGGLYRVHRSATRRFGAASGLGEITALAPDGEGGAFVASGCRGLFHLDSSGHVTSVTLQGRTDPEGLASEPCGISLGADRDGRVWARAGRRLFLVRRPGLDVRRVLADLPPVEGPVVATRGGSLWVISRTGLVRLVSTEGRVLRELAVPAPLMSASMGPDGDLWVGGDGAVFRVGRDAVRQFGPEQHVPRGLVRDILAEADGTVWIGSYGGGVGRLRDGRVARLTVEHGLPDNSVSRLLDDGRGRLWVSTNRGLAVVERRELQAVADGRLRMVAPVVLGPERGVAEANFGSPAGFADANGWLWFSTIEGVASIDAAAFPFNATPPRVRIESVSADGRPLAVGAVVRVPELTERVRVAFGVVELLYPERTRFRFRVEGLDRDWVDLGVGRVVDWAPPKPGRHRFLVEARNEDGVWSSTAAEVVFDVLPAWWQTTPLRAVALLTAVLSTVGAVRLRIRRIERRHAERLRLIEEQRDAGERLAGLRVQLEHVARVALAGELAGSLAHEVSQPIGAILNNAEAGRRHLLRHPQQPGQLGAIFDDIVADGLRASEIIRGLRGFLQPRGSTLSLVDLSGLVREMVPLVRRELAEARVQTDLALGVGLPAVEGHRVQLGQVVVNLVMNACEALAAVAGDRRITVATRLRDDRVELVVRDNGPGLAPEIAAHAFDAFVTTKPEGLGVGLAICRAIAEAHGGQLRAEPAQGGGLEVSLSLPPARPEVSRP